MPAKWLKAEARVSQNCLGQNYTFPKTCFATEAEALHISATLRDREIETEVVKIGG